MEMVHFIPPSQRRLAMLAAQADTAPALICGASGTGKGAIARWIHENGPRSARPYVIASQDTPLIQEILKAHGGTLVIPDIGERPLGAQKLLLGFLKTHSVQNPDGNGTAMLVNARVIATASQALEGRAQGGLFNVELLERLNVFRIDMPSLSRRKEEFDDIALAILGEITRELHKEHLRALVPEAWDRIRGYDWPGNIRELRNVLRVAVATAKGDRIEEGDLPDFGSDRIDFRATREQFEKVYLLEILKTFDWEIEKTCKMTRIDKTTLLSKMNQYGIEPSNSAVH